MIIKKVQKITAHLTNNLKDQSQVLTCRRYEELTVKMLLLEHFYYGHIERKACRLQNDISCFEKCQLSTEQCSGD